MQTTINKIIYADNEEELQDYIKEKYDDGLGVEVKILNTEFGCRNGG